MSITLVERLDDIDSSSNDLRVDKDEAARQVVNEYISNSSMRKKLDDNVSFEKQYNDAHKQSKYFSGYFLPRFRTKKVAALEENDLDELVFLGYLTVNKWSPFSDDERKIDTFFQNVGNMFYDKVANLAGLPVFGAAFMYGASALGPSDNSATNIVSIVGGAAIGFLFGAFAGVIKMEQSYNCLKDAQKLDKYVDGPRDINQTE